MEGRIHAVKEAEETRTHLKNEFEVLANRIFDEKDKKFKDTSQALLNPLREQLGEFRKKVEYVHEKDIESHSSLLTTVRNLQNQYEQLHEDAKQLTVALKGDPQKRGAWGEMILEKVLEASGLEKGREYELQTSFKGENGTLRPDAIVHLPRKRDVIIDSKMSLLNYNEATRAATQKEREEKLKAHAKSIRQHIKDLSGKYHNLEGLNDLETTVMFIPIESAFAEALRVDESIQYDAFKANIVLTTPSTLIANLKTIHMAWKTEDRQKNIDEIIKQIHAFLDKIGNFTGALEKIGENLNRAQNSYEDAHKRLISGTGSVASRAKKITDLGSFHTKKELPAISNEAE